MAHHRQQGGRSNNNNNNNNNDNEDTTPLTLEEAYLAFDRLNPFHPSGPPTVATLRRLEGQPHARKLFYGRQTLLHKCCCDGGYADRLDLITALVKTNPEAVRTYDQDGYWPLHYVVAAVRGQKGGRVIHQAVVQYLIEQEPLALLQPTRNERRAIPLHLAAENAALTVPVLDVLLQVFPETIHYRDAHGHLPIECAVKTVSLSSSSPGLSLNVIQRLIQAAPVLLSFVHHDDSLLIHRCLDRMEAIDEQQDEEIQTKSTRTILRDASLLERLVQACPAALKVQNAQGQTPLALACEAEVAVPCIYTLVRAWPEQVTTQKHLIYTSNDDDENDDEWNGVWLPTHLLQASLSWSNVQRWLDEDCQAATTRDAAGRLALHYAVVTQASCAVSLVRALLRANPAAVSQADHAGRLPLHYLALSTHQRRDQLLDLLLLEEATNQHDMDATSGLAMPDHQHCLPWMYAELVHFTAVYEASLAQGISIDHTEDLPSEVRWDIVQVLPEDEGHDS